MKADIRQSFPHLWLFFGAYFHQDWDCEAVDDITVVANFLRYESPEAVAATVVELRRLHRLDLDETALHRVVCEDLGNYYDPMVRGFTYARWLERLEALLTAPALPVP